MKGKNSMLRLDFDIEVRKVGRTKWLRVSDIATELGIGGHRNWGKDLDRYSRKVGHPVVKRLPAKTSNGKATFMRDGILYCNEEGLYRIIDGHDALGAQIGYWAAKEVFNRKPIKK